MLHKIVFGIAAFAGFICLLSATAWMANLIDSYSAIQFVGLALIVVVFTVYPYIMYNWYKKSRLILRQEL